MSDPVIQRDRCPSAREHMEEARATSANPAVMDQIHAVAHGVLALAEAQDRQARALERIADRLDSWNKEDGDRGELCVRRW